MPKYISINGPHNFVKKNLMTLTDSRGTYDHVICNKCGLEGKRRHLTQVEIDGRKSDEQINNCDGTIPSKIKITSGYPENAGPQFKNIKKGSVHDVIDPPEGYKNDSKGVWVMGIDEPVKILSHEFKSIN